MPLARPCLPKLMERRELEVTKMCTRAGQDKEVAGRRCLPRSRPGGWMPHFSLLAQPSLRVVEGTEEHTATLEE